MMRARNGFGQRSFVRERQRRHSDSSTLDKDELAHLLRDHREEGVAGIEVQQRDHFDDLLTYYSIRELAAIRGYLPLVSDDPLQDALEVLGHPSVVRYYEKNYPLLLPRLLRRRLCGDWKYVSPQSPRIQVVVEEMLIQFVASEKDAAVQQFLWYLDDGWTGHRSLADVIETGLADPEQVAKLLYLRRRNTASDEDGVVGFTRFVSTCVRYDQLMRTANDSVVSSAMWHLNAYWYRILRSRLLPIVRKAQRAVDTWERETVAANAPDPESVRVKFETVIRRLTSDDQGRPLEVESFVN